MKKYGKARDNKEKGYTLLEYCAGAVIIVTVVYGAMVALGGSLEAFLNRLNAWVQDRTNEIDTNTNSTTP